MKKYLFEQEEINGFLEKRDGFLEKRVSEIILKKAQIIEDYLTECAKACAFMNKKFPVCFRCHVDLVIYCCTSLAKEEIRCPKCEFTYLTLELNYKKNQFEVSSYPIDEYKKQLNEVIEKNNI